LPDLGPPSQNQTERWARDVMSKALLLSIMIATIFLPAVAAKEKNPKKGLRKAIIYMLVFNAFYLFGLLFLYGRI
jgi:hypothetical protein